MVFRATHLDPKITPAPPLLLKRPREREEPSALSAAIDAVVCLSGKLGGQLVGMEKPVRQRGFVCEKIQQADNFDRVILSFSAGYKLALSITEPTALQEALMRMDMTYRGFAFEGAAMALCLRECLVPGKSGLVKELNDACDGQFSYLVHVGAGWVMGWVPGARVVVDRLDPLLKWLAYDGLGFRETFFRWHHYCHGASAPRWIKGYKKNAFDQGVGRCLWFTTGGSGQGVIDAIAVFSKSRRADLWSGAALAATYAGQLEDPHLWTAHSEEHYPALAQGVCFAAKALSRAGQLNAYHENICIEIVSLPAKEAAAITDRCLEGLELLPENERYAAWQGAIRKQFSPE